MVKITLDVLRKRLQELRDDKASLEKKMAPLNKKRDGINARLQPLEAELRELDEHRKKVNEPMFEIDMEIARIVRMLPGDRSVPPVDVRVVEDKPAPVSGDRPASEVKAE